MDLDPIHVHAVIPRTGFVSIFTLLGWLGCVHAVGFVGMTDGRLRTFELFATKFVRIEVVVSFSQYQQCCVDPCAERYGLPMAGPNGVCLCRAELRRDCVWLSVQKKLWLRCTGTW